MFYRALAVSLSLLIGSTVLLRFAYQHPPGMSWIDALYFSTETIATVGYGDFSFMHQPLWLRIWGIGLMFAGVTTTAILVAFIADVLLSRRMAQSAGRRKVRHLRHHVIVVGLGSFGIRVVSDLKAAGYDVAVIERDEANRYLSTAAPTRRAGDLRRRHAAPDAGVRTHRRSPCGRGADAGRHGQHRDRHRAARDARTAHSAGAQPARRADRAAGVRPHARRCGRAALRVRERALHSRIWRRRGSSAPRWGCRCSAHSRWASARSWSAACTSQPGSELDGMRMFDLSTQTRVIAITRAGAAGAAASPARHQADARATPPTWSGPTANCWTPCAKGRVSSSPKPTPSPTSRRKGPHFRGVSGTFAAARARK